jgi:hypothetical protein
VKDAQATVQLGQVLAMLHVLEERALRRLLAARDLFEEAMLLQEPAHFADLFLQARARLLTATFAFRVLGRQVRRFVQGPSRPLGCIRHTASVQPQDVRNVSGPTRRAVARATARVRQV